MLWTVLGLLITFSISIIGVATSGKSRQVRATLCIFTVLGFGAAMYSTYAQEGAKRLAEISAQENSKKLAMANRHLEDMRGMLDFVRLTVGDLAKLNAIGGGAKYYIRISADTDKERLLPYLKRINAVFRGAEQSGLVAVREPRPGSRNYELVFGQGLEMAAAEVFYRLATMHKFPPPNQIPAIVPEPARPNG
ncbi:MAG: hypothetical protein A4E63_01389 [Syntrophorhabdus sp. PtaU1.Bin050]|nr:MAG: hypothetical protein A4E63_01389 [Syntrophorhabdus sp. PtaU1.Bin050]